MGFDYHIVVPDTGETAGLETGRLKTERTTLQLSNSPTIFYVVESIGISVVDEKIIKPMLAKSKTTFIFD